MKYCKRRTVIGKIEEHGDQTLLLRMEVSLYSVMKSDAKSITETLQKDFEYTLFKILVTLCYAHVLKKV